MQPLSQVNVKVAQEKGKNQGQAQYNRSTERKICRKQEALCLDGARLKVKQKDTFNSDIAFLRSEQLRGIPLPFTGA